MRGMPRAGLSCRNEHGAETPQAAGPAIPLCLQITPVARGRCCCGAFGKLARV
jgi:hypothetical protein